MVAIVSIGPIDVMVPIVSIVPKGIFIVPKTI